MPTVIMKKSHLLAALICLPWTAACRRDAPAAAPASHVAKAAMKNMEFTPAVIEIAKGGTVEWTNQDLTPHTVTSPTFGDSGSLAADQSWSHTFNVEGEFPYACTFHPTMKGTVIVR
jgi:plastocyanin